MIPQNVLRVSTALVSTQKKRVEISLGTGITKEKRKKK